MKPPTSQELFDEVNTVPSRSTHDFLKEGIESYIAKLIAQVQVDAQANIKRLDAFLKEEQRKNNPNVQDNYLEVAIGRKQNEIIIESRRAIEKIYMERDAALKALSEWENTQYEEVIR